MVVVVVDGERPYWGYRFKMGVVKSSKALADSANKDAWVLYRLPY
jgi:hypothetical protein